MIFDYTAKSGQERYVALADDLVLEAVRDLLARPQRWSGTPCLQGRWEWRDVSSADINSYIKAQVGDEMSAKDFRTWHGTVIAAVVLAEANERPNHSGPQARRVSGDERGGRLSRQHTGGGEELLRRSPGDRPVQRRRHDLTGAGRHR